MYEQIQYEVKEPAATISLCRPDRLNAWTDQMALEVKHAVAQAEADPRVVAIVLTGAGRGFCAGADLKGLSAISAGNRSSTKISGLDADPGDAEIDEGYRGTYTYLASVRKPVIAAINGACAGMAVPISLCCDLRFASDRAVFTVAFPRRGLVAEWGIAWFLPRVVGVAHALDLIMSGRKIDAAEAERIGLVNRTLPHDELLAHVYAYVDDLAQACSPASLQIAKRQVYEALQEPLAASHEKAVRLMVESFSRPDFKEGVQSFMEKRPPRFARIGKGA